MLIFLVALIAMIVFYIVYTETMFTSIGEIAERLSSIAFWVVFVSFIIFVSAHIGTDSKKINTGRTIHGHPGIITRKLSMQKRLSSYHGTQTTINKKKRVCLMAGSFLFVA